jgi:protein-S-isoprenylcysteine O-methyltransferase Ste14/pimeloyl-ACP methyl ester carboxylesterase
VAGQTRTVPLFLRAVLAFLALPGVVGFAVPLWIAWPWDRIRWIGLLPLAAGVALQLRCIREFYVVGKGTLAPWDPPRHLVTTGPYRLSRNPMYVGLMLIILGWALTLRSGRLLLYAMVVQLLVAVRVRTFEEPYAARHHRAEWDVYRASTPRWVLATPRARVLTVAALLVVLPLAGRAYEAYADSATRRTFQAPGRLVDVGGRRLHLLCIGDGSPIVLFEAPGFGVSSLSSATVRERVASRTTVCSYDRAGMAWSDPAPETLTAGSLARDLAALQDRAGLPAPFVLVASSVGGLTAEMFARMHPERTAGLIFLDAASSGLVGELEQTPLVRRIRAAAPILGTAAQFGVIRLLNPFVITGDSDAARRSRGFTYGARAIGTLAAILRGASDTVREFGAAPPLRADIPLVVLSASDPRLLEVPGLRQLSAVRSEARLRGHQRLAATSTRGVWKTVPNSQHLIAVSNPDVVIAEIFAMLDQLR